MGTIDRVAMTTSCRDADSIPKVRDAGQVLQVDGDLVQVMHNGVRVAAGAYHGEWMSRIIAELRGHHEPQEERLFHEPAKLLRDLSIGDSVRNEVEMLLQGFDANQADE